MLVAFGWKLIAFKLLLKKGFGKERIKKEKPQPALSPWPASPPRTAQHPSSPSLGPTGGPERGQQARPSPLLPCCH